MIFDNLFLKGMFTNKNRPMNTELNIRIGIANIGYFENIPIMMQYNIFLIYLISIKAIPNLFVFSIPL